MCNTIHDRIFRIWCHFTPFSCKSFQTTPVRGRFLQEIDCSKHFFPDIWGFFQFYLESYSKSANVYKRLAQELESHHLCGWVTGTDWFYMHLRTFNWGLDGLCAYLDVCKHYSNWELFSRRDQEVNPRVLRDPEAPQIEETLSSWSSSSWHMELLMELLVSWPME